MTRFTMGPAMAVAVVAALGAAGCGDAGGDGYDYESTYYGDAGTSGWADTAPNPGIDSDGRDAPDGDQYEYVGTNPFIETAHDPFSTFAADVDTASYDIFARDVERGVLPNRASVRLEEWVNYFDYDYEAPAYDAEVPFSIHLAASTHAMGRQITQLRVGIQAAAPPERVKLPTNLVYLVDVSGSMDSDDKIELAKYLIEESLEVLDGTDTVSIVTYSGSVQVALPPTRATERGLILDAVRGLVAAGSTAGGAAMDLAYEQAAAGYIEGGFNHVIMMTDGDFNVGVSSTEALVQLIEEKRETGVTLTALGFGSGNLNDAMMERVSNAGNGIYSVITSREHAARYAAEEMLNAINLVAKDMKIQVEFNPEHVVAYRLLGYENRAIADMDFRNDVVDAGEVGAGHQVTALYEVVLTGQSIPFVEGAPEAVAGEPTAGEREIAAENLVEVRVRWKDLGASAEDPAYETSTGLTPADIAAELSAADDDLAWAAAVAAFAEIIKESPFAQRADLSRIETIVTAQADRDEDRGRFLELFRAASEMLAPIAP